MYCVNVALGNVCWRLLYKEEEKAKSVFDSLKRLPIGQASIIVEDDFGSTLDATMGSIHGVMYEDLDKTKMANVELHMHQQRVNVMCQKAAQADPSLRASQRGNGIMPLSPMGGFPTN